MANPMNRAPATTASPYDCPNARATAPPSSSSSDPPPGEPVKMVVPSSSVLVEVGAAVVAVVGSVRLGLRAPQG